MGLIQKAAVAGALLSGGCSTPGQGFEQIFGPWEETTTIAECNGGSAREEYYDRGLAILRGRGSHHSLTPDDELCVQFSAEEIVKVKGRLSATGQSYSNPILRFRTSTDLIIDSAVADNLHIWVKSGTLEVWSDGCAATILTSSDYCRVSGAVLFFDENREKVAIADFVPEPESLHQLAMPYPEPASDVLMADKD